MTGMHYAFRRVLDQSDFDRFARLCGDDNPIHCDPEFARRSHFGRTVAHGMFLYSLIDHALAESMSTPGMLQVEQELMFPRPTFAGDDIEVLVTPVEIEDDGSLQYAASVSKQVHGERVVTVDARTRVLASGTRAALAVWADACRDRQGNAESGDAENKGLRPGMRAAATRAFTADDLADFFDLTGNRNPLYADDTWARQQGFTGRLVPAPLLAGMFSELLGTRLPGRGTGWMKQKLRYLSPAYLDEPIAAQVEITRIRAQKELVNLATTITGADGRLICTGEALVLVRNLESQSTASP